LESQLRPCGEGTHDQLRNGETLIFLTVSMSYMESQLRPCGEGTHDQLRDGETLIFLTVSMSYMKEREGLT